MPRLLVLLLHSTAQPERAVTGLTTARAAQAAGSEVHLWLADEGVRLGIAAVAETLSDPDDETSAVKTLEALVAAGATLYLDRPSFAARLYTEDALRPGAQLVGSEQLAQLIEQGLTPVTM